MKKGFIIGMTVVIMFIVLLHKNDSGTTHTAKQVQLESIRGDVVELQGKSMFYHNKYGEYPINHDDVYSLSDAEVIKSLKTFEKFFTSKEGTPDRDYIRENVKLVNVGELKNKGITYSLANKKTRYFLDTKTGKILVADLMEDDTEYAKEATDKGEYRVIETIVIEDGVGNEMKPVHGSFKSGTSIYFYGGGSMRLARRDEVSKQIYNLDNQVEGVSELNSILYVQPSTGKCAVEKDGEVQIIQLNLR